MKKVLRKSQRTMMRRKRKLKSNATQKNTIQNIHSRNNRSYNAEMKKKGISEITFHNSRICNIQ